MGTYLLVWREIKCQVSIHVFLICFRAGLEQRNNRVTYVEEKE